MEGNILSGGPEAITEIKENLIKLNKLKENNDLLQMEEAKLEKNIQNKEKAITDEIASITRKRKEEIEASYNEQIDNIQARIKKIQSKKERSKSEKIAARIEEETADLCEEHRQLVAESKAIFKQNQVPSYCNTKLFYALYMPKGFGDYMIICISLILTLIVIPLTIYMLLLPENELIYLALVYIITVIVCFGAYMLIDSKTKEKFREPITKVRSIRNHIEANKAKQNIIKNRIIKDKDESKYGLEKYDQEVKDLKNEISYITEQKKDALILFENTTRFVIGEEIKLRHKEELEKLKEGYNRVLAEIKKTEAYITALSIDITSNYEAYLGKQYMSIEKLEQLEERMKENNLVTISEAIASVKQEGKI